MSQTVCLFDQRLSFPLMGFDCSLSEFLFQTSSLILSVHDKQAATVGLGTKVVFDEDGDTCSILAAVKAEDTSGTKQSEDVRKRQCEGSGGSEADRKGGKGKGKGKKIDYQKGSKGGCAADGKISEEKLHPSWEAKLNARKETGIAAFTGTKVTF